MFHGILTKVIIMIMTVIYRAVCLTTKHLLQFCTLNELLRKGIWPDHISVAR